MLMAIRDSQVSAVGYKDAIAGVKDLGLESLELDVGRDLNSRLLSIDREIADHEKRH